MNNPSDKRSPQCFRRSASLRLRGEISPMMSRRNRPDVLHCLSAESTNSKDCYSPDDDFDNTSLLSVSSVGEDSFVPLNGTTFSGRSMKYMRHSSLHAGLSEDYLTPTQRAQKQIRRLKALLLQAKKELEEKDNEIFNLTKEIVEMKLEKNCKTSPDEKSNSSDAVTIKEISPDCPSVDLVDGINYASKRDMQSSSDSGHFEEVTSLYPRTLSHNIGVGTERFPDEFEHLKAMYEEKIEQLCRKHSDEIQMLKEKQNDKVEALLNKLTDVNTRYCELLPSYEQARERINELENQLESASKQLSSGEERHRALYLEMYNKGKAAATFEKQDQICEPDASTSTVNRVSVPQLLEQLQVTQKELENVRAMYRRIIESQKGTGSSIDPETTLQFLKSAVYYFLTDPENHQGHLNAIESILGFTDEEKRNIQKMKPSYY